MGANQFDDTVLGRTPEEAFGLAKRQAAWDYGHAGYTGSIAEKHGFIYLGKVKGVSSIGKLASYAWDQVDQVWAEKPKKVKLPKGVPPMTEGQAVEINNKWERAGCYEITGKLAADIKARMGRKGTRDRVFYFFGWASS